MVNTLLNKISSASWQTEMHSISANFIQGNALNLKNLKSYSHTACHNMYAKCEEMWLMLLLYIYVIVVIGIPCVILHIYHIVVGNIVI